MSRDTSEHQDRVERVIAEYLDAIDRGETVERTEFLSRYSEIAEELRMFFEAQDDMQRLAEPIAAPTPIQNTFSPNQTGNPKQVDVSLDFQGQPTFDLHGSKPKSPPPHEEILSEFGNYELLHEIARGGMGVVYKARQINVDRIVALKMILTGQLASKKHVQRFQQEAEAAAQLKHPGIVPIFDVGKHDGHHYFTMAYVDGPNLAEVLEGSPLPANEAAPLVQRLAQAIAYAHSKGVIHRDLKPSNILLAHRDEQQSGEQTYDIFLTGSLEQPDRAGHYEPMITDFGLAKRIEGTRDLTGTGQVLGTPSYMPPEQARGQLDRIGVESDVYSLGAILYDALTGRPPFHAATAMDTLIQVLRNDPPLLSQLNPQTPKDLETICLKCLEKEPSKRYPTAQALADDLSRYLRNEPIVARPVGPIERGTKWVRRNPLVAALSFAVFLTLLAGTVVASMFAIQSHRHAQRANEEAEESQRNEKKAETKAHEAFQAEKRAKENAELAYTEKQRAETALQEAEEARRQTEHLVYDNRIQESRRDWEQGEVYDAQEALDRTRWDLRGWEYDYLAYLYDRECALSGSKNAILSCAFSLDQQWLAGSDQDGIVTVWELWSRQEKCKLEADVLFVDGLAFSPDSQYLATAGIQGVIKIWKMPNCEKVLTIDELKRPIHALAFNPDGKQVVAGYNDGQIRIWDAQTGTLVKSWEASKQPVRRLAVRSDFAQIASVDSQDRLSLWDTQTGESLKLRIRSILPNSSLQFDAQGELLCWAGSSLPSLQFASTGKKVFGVQANFRQLGNARRARDRSPSRLAWSAKTRRAAVITKTGTIQIWQQGNPEPIRTIPSQGNNTGLLEFDANGQWLATQGKDNTVRLWPVEEEEGVRGLELAGRRPLFHSRSPLAVSLSDDGNDILLGEVATGATLDTLKGHTNAITCRAISPDGKRLASAAQDNTIRVWDLESRKQIELVPQLASVPQHLAWAADSRYLAWSDAEKRVIIRDLARDEPKESFHVPNGSRLASGVTRSVFVFTVPEQTDPKQDKLVLFDCRQWRSRELGSLSNVQAIHVSPDGEWVLVRRRNKWQWIATATGDRKPCSFQGTVTSLQFSPDSQYLAVILNNNRLGLFHVASQQGFSDFEMRENSVVRIAFSPDSKRLLSATRTGSIRLWELQARQPLLELEAKWKPAARPPFLGFADSGRYLVCSDTRTTKVWDRGPSTRVLRVREFTGDVMALAMRSDRKQFALLTDKRKAYVWDATTGQVVFAVGGCTGWGNGIAFSPDGSMLAVACNNKVEIRETSAGKLLRTFEQPQAPVTAVAFHPDGGVVVAGTRKGNLIGWQIASGAEVFQRKGTRAIVRKIAFDSEGKRIAVSYSIGHFLFGTYRDLFVTVWDWDRQRPLGKLGVGKLPIHDLDVDTTGENLALAVGDQVVLYNLEKKVATKKFRGVHGDKLLGVAFGPEDKRLMTSGQDGTVRVWDLATNREEFTFKGHRHEVNGVLFSEDGQWGMTRSLDFRSFLFELVGSRVSFPLSTFRRRGDEIRK